MNDHLIYLDNNATTSLAPEVMEAMSSYLHALVLNPSAPYPQAMRVKQDVQKARRSIAHLINVPSEENILFTGSGSEANSWAFHSALSSFAPQKSHVITTRVEHPSIHVAADSYGQKGYGIKKIGVDNNGTIDIDELVSTLDPETKLVSIQYANSETGVIQALDRIAEQVKAYNENIMIHVDAVQAAGKVGVNINALPIDLVSLSAHKFHGPKGIGALYARDLKKVMSFIHGKQENGLRGGTENVSGIIGMGKAAEVAVRDLNIVSEQITTLRDEFENFITENIKNICIFGSRAIRLPNTSFFSLKGIENSILISKFASKGILVSSGSACASGSLSPSQTLLAMGVDEAQAWSAIRVSLSRFTTIEEINTLKQEVVNVSEALITF
jgi:cysteine desulfurase